MNSTVQSALFYVKFKAIAPKLKDLVNEIEKRCPAHREYVKTIVLLNPSSPSLFYLFLT